MMKKRLLGGACFNLYKMLSMIIMNSMYKCICNGTCSKQASNAPSMLLEELQLKKYELESLFADNDNVRCNLHL